MNAWTWVNQSPCTIVVHSSAIPTVTDFFLKTKKKVKAVSAMLCGMVLQHSRCCKIKQDTTSSIQLHRKCLLLSNSLSSNTLNMSNKQELEVMVYLENHDLIVVTVRWWMHNWSRTIEAYKLFRRDKQGR